MSQQAKKFSQTSMSQQAKKLVCFTITKRKEKIICQFKQEKYHRQQNILVFFQKKLNREKKLLGLKTKTWFQIIQK